MENYNDVLAQLQSEGLQVTELIADGRVHRVRTADSREKRGWYVLHEWQADDGRRYLVGSYGVWQGPERNARKVELRRDMALSSAERAALRARMLEDSKRAKAQRDAEAARAARRAAAVWAKALKEPPDGVEVEYLRRKGIQPHGVRYTPTGAVVVPMMDARGDVKGLQFILPRSHPRVAKTGRDKEYWPAGLSKTGRWFQIGALTGGCTALLCEGFATGATLHEATGLPVVVAFDAGNLLHVAQAIRKHYRVEHILVCADDDYLQRCACCGKPTDVSQPTCSHCGQSHERDNPGVRAAAAAALAVGGAWLAPKFPGDRGGKKLTDFNDLALFPNGGLPLVRAQVEAKLAELGWQAAPARSSSNQGGGDGGMVARLTVDDAVARYIGIYGMGGKVLFDSVERRIVHRDDVLNLLPRHGWEDMRAHPNWRVVRDTEIGFDPSGQDPQIKCNLFGGLPMQPKPGECSTLLELLHHLCSLEPNSEEVFHWVIRWLAYPLQHLGAKMQSAIVVHGPQGTGKSRFFEAYGKIFGPYARVLGQEALEDKFNSDWAEKKLFILADEVLARSDMFHIKNRLKGFITGDTIRVNPKNIAAHTERNCMNIVFLSNERMPLVLEKDDRRHLVLWSPPKLDEAFYEAVNAEIDNGGVEALYDYLLKVDLSGFHPWAKPPMTKAKRDLVLQSASSEERFVEEWLALEIEGADGEPLPVCPCLGTHLFQAYERWCAARGERHRRLQELIGFLGKRPGWQAGKTCSTWTNLRDRTVKSRKMVIPSIEDMAAALRLDRSATRVQERLQRNKFESTGQWLTAGFFAFEAAISAASARASV